MALFGRGRSKSFERCALDVCERLRPDSKWTLNRDDDHIAGNDITIHLGNLRLIWEAKDASERPAWLEGHLSEILLQVTDEDSGMPPQEEIRSMIRPRVLVESSRLQAMIENKPSSVVPPFRSLTDDLVGLVGIDSPTAITLVSSRRLEEWNITFNSLWEVGVRTVAGLGDDQGWSHVNGLVYVSQTTDDYTNSRLLGASYLDQLRLSGPIVVLVPHRNSLIVASFINDEAVALACDLALQQINEPSPICLKPFVWADGELRDLFVNDGHPAARSVRLLRLVDDDINYKQVTSQLVQLVGEHMTVGSFFVDQERLVSSTNWGPSPSLLPKADEIVFVDDEHNPSRGMVAAWDDAAAVVGNLMTATEFYPPRFRVDGLPDAETIRAIGSPVGRLASF